MSLIAQARAEIRRQLRNSCSCTKLNVWLTPQHAEALLGVKKKVKKKKK